MDDSPLSLLAAHLLLKVVMEERGTDGPQSRPQPEDPVQFPPVRALKVWRFLASATC